MAIGYRLSAVGKEGWVMIRFAIIITHLLMKLFGKKVIDIARTRWSILGTSGRFLPKGRNRIVAGTLRRAVLMLD